MSDLSTEAESVGVYKAKVLLLKIKLEKEIRAKNIPRNFSSHLNHPPRESLWLAIFGLAYNLILP